MKTSKRVLMIILALVIFCSFAIGSRSSDDEDSAADDSVTTTQGVNDNSGNSDYEVGTGTVKTWTTDYGSNYIRMILPIKNTGSKNLYIESATMDIENADGTLAQTLSYVQAYPVVIEPGETAYYYEETSLDEGLTVGADYQIAPHVQVEDAVVPCIRFATSEVQFKDDEYSGFVVTGRVENTSDEAVDWTYVVVNCYDAAGNMIAQEYTSITNSIQPGEKIGFEINSWTDDIKASDIATYDIYAVPSQYNW